ncbi:Membrane protein involved in the export of O-antigen and teichoic acid [Butyrivibrio sp. ob235]|uniref:lipopolysaccharide biosynthesis protein n=1 Tax=Butyrivibrio sp. ob235 TaxID=1761780 RepID=UPI0008B337AA|nr:oligosaccharide flippase family protein [Butyrivibrio sp. ob235]SEK63856.1 Membrane protein involved in the export of O-antigen and teichoic acid [Butyrivibrio sp. ob235]
MSRINSLIKNTGILFFARMCTQLVSFLLLPFYTSLLSTEEYGQADIYITLSMIIIPFLTMQLEMALFRYYISSKNDDEKKGVVSCVFTMVAAVLFVVICIYSIIFRFVSIDYKWYLMGYYLSLAIYNVLVQLCRAQGKNKVYGMASFLVSFIAIVLNILLIGYVGLRVSGIILSYIIAYMISCIYMVFRTNAIGHFDLTKVKTRQCKKYLSYSSPLIANQISSWIINYSDRIIVTKVWGVGVNGIYAVANKFSNATNSFWGTYNVAWTENAVRCIDDPDANDYISSVLTVSFNLYLVAITGILSILPFVFSLLVKHAYLESYNYIPMLLLASFFSGMAAMVGSIYIAMEKTKMVSVTTFFAAICNITVHIVLLRTCYLYAAAISSFVAFLLLFLYRLIFIRRYRDITIKMSKVILQGIILSVVWYAYVTNNRIILGLGIVISLCNAIRICHILKKETLGKSNLDDGTIDVL